MLFLVVFLVISENMRNFAAQKGRILHFCEEY